MDQKHIVLLMTRCNTTFHKVTTKKLPSKSFDIGLEDLRGIDFSGAYLSNSRFEKNNLGVANFEKAVLIGTTFSSVSLIGASFKKADLTGTVFYETDLKNASFAEANLDGTNFNSAKNLTTEQFKGAKNLNKAIWGRNTNVFMELMNTK